MLKVSVIIATKNRADQLRSVSLPSLARQQGAPPFEVIVWDTSDNEESAKLLQEFAVVNPGMEIRHFKAPRVGLARQRNDALKAATGDIVFYIDDDSEVSVDGLAALAGLFASDPQLAGGCLPLDYNFPAGTMPLSMTVSGPFAPLMEIYYQLFEPAKKASGYFPPIAPKDSSSIFYLFGCDMAFRKDIFVNHHFDERLHRFSNYPLCDDLTFSRILIQQGRRLAVTTKGYVIHHAASGTRMQVGFNTGRVEGYNAGIVWLVAAYPWSRWTVFSFIWARTGVLCGALLPCLRRPWELNRWERVAGYLFGLWVFFWEEFLGMAKRPSHLN